MNYQEDLRRRVARQRAFHQRNEAGDLLVYINGDRSASLEAFLCAKLHEGPVERILDPQNIPAVIEEYVGPLRESFANVQRFADDVVPACLVYWGVGSITAAMTGLEPMHAENTSWLEPNLDWERIGSLRFDPQNKWVQFALHVNNAMWSFWEEDFHVLPYLHRSPLDAANGIRGTALFEEMYTAPQRVKRLIDWCVDWQLAVEAYLDEHVNRPAPAGWGNAVWGTWLPDRGVFVNGDPVGLISREMALEFEQPYTARLFTETGGGFFHNHTVGLYQADLVSRTPGTLVQWFVNDPKQPSCTQAILDSPDLREKLLAASLDAPIALAGLPVDRADEVLDVARRGRFILAFGLGPEAPAGAAEELIRKVRRVSSLD